MMEISQWKLLDNSYLNFLILKTRNTFSVAKNQLKIRAITTKSIAGGKSISEDFGKDQIKDAEKHKLYFQVFLLPEN